MAPFWFPIHCSQNSALAAFSTKVLTPGHCPAGHVGHYRVLSISIYCVFSILEESRKIQEILLWYKYKIQIQMIESQERTLKII